MDNDPTPEKESARWDSIDPKSNDIDDILLMQNRDESGKFGSRLQKHHIEKLRASQMQGMILRRGKLPLGFALWTTELKGEGLDGPALHIEVLDVVKNARNAITTLKFIEALREHAEQESVQYITWAPASEDIDYMDSISEKIRANLYGGPYYTIPVSHLNKDVLIEMLPQRRNKHE